jgi:sucrose-6F-phosphate phosphohydrolase
MERMTMLVSDLDGTLLGDERALVRFSEWYARNNGRLRLVYSSGRFLDSIRKSIDDSRLPEPDAIIGGVGTEIHDVSARRRYLGWPPVTYGWNPYIVRATCGLHVNLEEQPQHLVSYYKVSYYGYELGEGFLEQLARQLASAGQDVKIVYSSQRDLDILPAETSKGAAAAFLAERWRIGHERVIVAGDSGNDLDMFQQGFRGIVVRNAQAELMSLSSPNVYHARGCYAVGVIEGLQYWLAQCGCRPAAHGPSMLNRALAHGMRE